MITVAFVDGPVDGKMAQVMKSKLVAGGTFTIKGGHVYRIVNSEIARAILSGRLDHDGFGLAAVYVGSEDVKFEEVV